MIFNSFGEMEQKRPLDIIKATTEEENNKGGDGSSIEVAKRPRGRPPGSKNKPKPPVIITRELEPSAAMRPHVLEITAGHDIIEALSRFSQKRNIGICVLSGNGSVGSVTLRQPLHPTASSPAGSSSTVTFRGKLEILSMSATFLPAGVDVMSIPGVTISLAGPQGQVIGGLVVGPLVAAGTVVMVAAGFEKPVVCRLPVEDAEIAVTENNNSVGSEEKKKEECYGNREYESYRQQPVAGESCGMAIYSSHFPSEVIWSPTARAPHPPY